MAAGTLKDCCTESLLFFVQAVSYRVTNPGTADFGRYLKRDSGVLGIHEYQRQNSYVASLYNSKGYSLRRGQQERLVLGLFGNFIPLKEQSA